ncbi:hypothetical protein [Gemmobacter sp. 24YEA27]|uniref:hypothetical protein n=1 Tax=Gemmobacter sp. 24YEA27 TaxID=3040672 RepID=UPI0024B3861F|nr:hypothetical protein [Gemmobacter sp. 24YEA27]
MSARVYGDALRLIVDAHKDLSWFSRQKLRADLPLLCSFIADLFHKDISDVERDLDNLLKVRR